MKFTLPMPPSINQTYGVAGSKMYKTREVKDWIDEAGYIMLTQNHGGKMLLEDCWIKIEWFYKVDRDIDAGLKSLLDLFQIQRIVKNDRQFRRLIYMGITEDKENPRVEVELDEIK